MSDHGKDDSQWAIIGSRFVDPLDLMPDDDPIIRMLKAQRARIDREYAEAEAVRTFGAMPQDKGVLCDDCYSEFMEWFRANVKEVQ